MYVYLLCTLSVTNNFLGKSTFETQHICFLRSNVLFACDDEVYLIDEWGDLLHRDPSLEKFPMDSSKVSSNETVGVKQVLKLVEEPVWGAVG